MMYCRYVLANKAPPRVVYTDSDCCCDSGSSKYQVQKQVLAINSILVLLTNIGFVQSVEGAGGPP